MMDDKTIKKKNEEFIIVLFFPLPAYSKPLNKSETHKKKYENVIIIHSSFFLFCNMYCYSYLDENIFIKINKQQQKKRRI